MTTNGNQTANPFMPPQSAIQAAQAPAPPVYTPAPVQAPQAPPIYDAPPVQPVYAPVPEVPQAPPVYAPAPVQAPMQPVQAPMQPVQAPMQPVQAPMQQTPAYTPPMPGGAGNVNNMAFDVDLTNVQTGYSIPDGDYVVRCVDVEQGVSKAGNSQFIWTFIISDGEYKDREFKSFTALTPAAMWKVAETVTALGLGVTGQKIKFTRSEVIGRQCIATMEESEYNGQIRSSISNVKPMVV